MERLIAGRRAVVEALQAHPTAIVAVYASQGDLKALATTIALAKRVGTRVEPRSREELDALAGPLRHQGIIAIAGDYRYAALDTLLVEERPVLVALDQIQDPHNLGAIVRTSVALGAQGIITLKDRACPVTAAVVRASAGATEHARIARVTNLGRTLKVLKSRGLQVVGLAGEAAIDLEQAPEAPMGRVLVIGSEGKGLRRLVREACDVIVRIHLPGPIHSLNASVAAGIALHASCRPRDIDG
ncbi:MAG: 23S rRNA (guanosine(2251)-2'-O)-methyltransferase RlmB [Myxococcales bacterium]|nr:23S rRNA (guanosine(2251)-2'-O)-methyltransferase RlmB [Myxococcales bacterium]MDD9965838.1 23S rRNA (guanosine(2251)-2'-O)-methyltransferase RlmB [Myxococcales bacterium]